MIDLQTDFEILQSLISTFGICDNDLEYIKAQQLECGINSSEFVINKF